MEMVATQLCITICYAIDFITLDVQPFTTLQTAEKGIADEWLQFAGENCAGSISLGHRDSKLESRSSMDLHYLPNGSICVCPT